MITLGKLGLVFPGMARESTFSCFRLSDGKMENVFEGRLPKLEVNVFFSHVSSIGFMAAGFPLLPSQTLVLSHLAPCISRLVFCLANPSPFPTPTQQLNIWISASLFFCLSHVKNFTCCVFPTGQLKRGRGEEGKGTENSEEEITKY